MLWRRSIGSVTPIAVSRWALHLMISSNDFTWILSTIYNSQVLSDHKKLWHFLSKMSNLDYPWLLNGDFNAITAPDEHRDGEFVNYFLKATLILILFMIIAYMILVFLVIVLLGAMADMVLPTGGQD